MEDPIHVFLLHYIFESRINKVLKSFSNGWNKHHIRTERNWSPEKLWSNGMIDLRNSCVMQVEELQCEAID